MLETGSFLHMEKNQLKCQLTTDILDEDRLLFGDISDTPDADSSRPYVGSTENCWKVLVVDDDPDVHHVTRMVLGNLEFKKRRINILTANSGLVAKQLILDHPDIAVILLDVVMETDCSGLDVVRFVRNDLKNTMARIILRTGQPGFAPERQVINDFEINDYKDKSDLTAPKLITSIVTSLRGYDDLKTIQALLHSNEKLEQLVCDRTQVLQVAHDELKQQSEARLQILQKLHSTQYLLDEAQRIAKIGNFIWNLQSDAMTWSEQVYKLLEIDPNQFHPSLLEMLKFIPDKQRGQVESEISRAVASGEPYSIEHSMLLPDGRSIVVRQQGQTLYKGEPAIHYLIGILQDITEQHRADEHMRKLSTAIEQAADSVMITSRKGVIEYVNSAFTTITGYSKDEAIGKTPAILKSEKQNPSFYRNLWKTIQRGEIFSDVLINRRKDGGDYYEEKTIAPQRDKEGLITHFISTSRDITRRMADQDRLHQMAHHDALTGLPNRILLHDRIEQAVARCRWHDRKVAVLFLDMDRFKIINDTLGHDAGDALLIKMSERLLDCVREGDTVARLGGDEFAIVLNDMQLKNDIHTLAEIILKAMREPFLLKGRELFMTTSIGISFFPDDGQSGVDLLKKADVAMYSSKGQGKNCFSFYDSGLESATTEILTLESQLRRALEREQYELHYQPQLDILSGEITGVEALLRWNHPEQRAVTPYQFIPILEETGMILPVGEWVMRRACEQERARQLNGLKPLRVSVNVSIRQFRERNFVTTLEKILNETGLEPRYLELEITEGVLINNMTETSHILHQLHELGIGLAIDDFGTGYSSMNYLSRLPFDLLKIDRSFITESTNSKDDAAIVTAVVTLAHALNMRVIAEGVETPEQLKLLHHLGCDLIQGYLCSPPRHMSEINTALNDNDNRIYRCLDCLDE